MSGLNEGILTFLDELFLNASSIFNPMVNNLTDLERNGGRARKLLDIFGICRHPFNKLKRITSNENTGIEVKYNYDNSNQAYIANILREIGRMTPTSIRRIRFNGYKEAWKQLSLLGINTKPYSDILQATVDYTGNPSTFKQNKLEEFLDEHGSFKKGSLPQDLITFINNYSNHESSEFPANLWVKIHNFSSENGNQQESFVGELKSPGIQVIAEDSEGPFLGLVVPHDFPQHEPLSPSINYLHMEKAGQNYYLIKLKESGRKDTYVLHPKTNCPVQPHSSNSSTNCSLIYPVTAQHGMFEVIEMKFMDALLHCQSEQRREA